MKKHILFFASMAPLTVQPVYLLLIASSGLLRNEVIDEKTSEAFAGILLLQIGMIVSAIVGKLLGDLIWQKFTQVTTVMMTLSIGIANLVGFLMLIGSTPEIYQNAMQAWSSEGHELTRYLWDRIAIFTWFMLTALSYKPVKRILSFEDETIPPQPADVYTDSCY